MYTIVGEKKITRDVLEERGGGVGPSSYGPSRVSAEGGPKILKLKSSWHQRRQSNIWLKHWQGKRGGGVYDGGEGSPYGCHPF